MTRHPLPASVVVAFLLALACGGGGCAVPQSQNVGGKTAEIVEPISQRSYYLYLPQNYTTARSYPLVVSIHGMKPFDNALPQLMTWRKICDENGWIAIAPQLRSPDMLNQFPFSRIDSVILQDETLIVASIHDVSRRCSVDTRHVMLTGWSSGGYLIHYVGARHPELFSLIAPQGSNFHEPIMPKYVNDAARQLPIYIYHGQHDLGIVVRDSNAAVQWYFRNGYRNVKMDEAPGGHERHPELAAKYFLDQIRDDPNGIIASAADGSAEATAWLGQPTRIVTRPGAGGGPAVASVDLRTGAGLAVGADPSASMRAYSPLSSAGSGVTNADSGPALAPLPTAASNRQGQKLPPPPTGRVASGPMPNSVFTPPDATAVAAGQAPARSGEVLASTTAKTPTLDTSSGSDRTSSYDATHFAPPRVVSAGPALPPKSDDASAKAGPGAIRETVSPADPKAAVNAAVPVAPAPSTFRPPQFVEPDAATRAVAEPDRLPGRAVSAPSVAPTLTGPAPAPLPPAPIRPADNAPMPAAPDGNPVGRLIPAMPTPSSAALSAPAAMPQALPVDTSAAVRILPSASEGDAPLTVEFRCEVRGISSPIVRYRWRLEGSLFGTTHYAMLTFHRPGAYPIELLLTDAAGNSYRTTTTIRVNAK